MSPPTDDPASRYLYGLVVEICNAVTAERLGNSAFDFIRLRQPFKSRLRSVIIVCTEGRNMRADVPTGFSPDQQASCLAYAGELDA